MSAPDAATARADRTPATRRAPVQLAVTYAARFWQIGMALVCTPIYLNLVGPEGFGVIGLFLTLQRVVSLLDSGFSRTINRELASNGAAARSADLLRTLEVVYFAICVAAFLLVLAGGNLAASLKAADGVDVALGSRILLLMATAIGVQLLSNYYAAALQGLERHVTLNSVQIAWQTVRFGGGVAVLALRPDLEYYFAWQTLCGVVYTAVVATVAWRSMPVGIATAAVRPKLIRSVGRYATGATLCAVTAVVMTQVDKLVLFQTLEADAFGYYMVAWSFAATMFVAVSPISAVMFPRLARLFADGDTQGLRRAYHAGSQATLLVAAPLAAAGAVGSGDAMLAWLGDADTATQCSGVASILVLAIGVNCLNTMPHTLQMATGWTGLVNRMNLIAIPVFAPLVYVACTRWGAVGAAWVWATFATAYLAAQVVFMHRRLLPDDLGPWSVRHAAALVLAMAAALVARAMLAPQGRVESLLALLACWAAALAATTAVCPLARGRLLRVAQRLWSTTRRTSHAATPR